MKKFYSLLVMMLVGFAATWAADETITFSEQGYTNQQAITTVSGTDFTITFDKGTNSSNAPKYYTSGTAIRAYAGNTFTVSSTTKTITTIEIGFGSGGDSNEITADADTYEDGTWTGSASSVTFTIGGTKGNRRIASIAVTYAEGGSEPAQKYAINYNQMENGSVTGPAEAAEGATVTLTVEPDNGYQLASLTVEDANEVAISVSNNQFTMPASAVYVSATFEEKPAADGDVINYEFTGISGTSYSDWSGKTGDSGTVYAGNSGGTYSSVQLRSKDSNSGIIVTKSIGNARKVTVTWNSNTADARILDIYGSNTAYTAVSDLYDSNKQGTKIGSIGTSSTELTINDDYAYIGLRSNESALYLDEIVIKWEASAAPAVAEPVISGTTPFEGETEVTITAADGLSIYYTVDGSDPTVNSTLYEGAFTINATTTVKAIATDGTNVSSIASKEFTKIEPVMSIADFIGSTGTQTFGIPVVALGQNGQNLYIVDENNTAGLLVYGTIDQTYSFGDVIPAGFSGTYLLFRSQHELASPAGFAASTAQATLTPMEASISDISHANFGRYAVLRGATISGTIITVGSETVELYNRFGVTAPTDGGTYNIYGVISIYNEGAQFLPISFEAVDVPEPTKYAIEIDDQIVNGSIEADKAEAAEGETVTLTVTPATGYELEAITVLDGDANEVEVSANYTFEMPASDVIVSATFVEQGEQPQPGGTTVTDELTYSLIGVTGTTYTAWTNVEGASGTVYAGSTAGGNEAIQLRSNKNVDGIVSTSSVGNVKSVTLKWNTNTSATRTVSIYGSNTAYTAASDLYDSSKQGTLLDEFNIDDATNSVSKLTVDGDYAYVGIRSKSGAIYLDGIDIEWATSTEPVTKYAIEIDEQIVNGTVEADKAEAAEGEIVSLTVTPAQGYELEAITVLDGDANEVEVSANNTFVMPASNVLVSATFKEAAPVEMKTTNATIVFVSRDADSSSEFSTLDKLLEQVEEGADYITAISDASKVYGGKNGLKLGTGSAIGKFTITLDGTYAAKKLVVGAAKYGSDAGNLTVAGNTIAADDLVAEIKEFEFELDPTVGLSEIAIATSAKRAYVKSIAIICEEEQPVETTDMAEVTEAGEYVVTVGNVVAFDDDAQTVYTTDGQENWLPILIEDADLYAEAKAAATLSQIAGSFDASKTAPLFTATAFKAEGNFEKNSQEIYPFDLADEEQELNPKAGQVIKIKGIWYGGELRAYSGANGGNRGRSFTVLGATDALVEGTAYSIPVAVTLKAAWDEEAPAGAPKRVAKDGDAAFQNLQGKIVGGADMIEGVSTAVTDLNSDKAISGVQYVNVAGQVSAEPFEGVNIVVTTYVDGSRSAVKVVR